MPDILEVCFEGLSVHTVTMDLVEHLLLNQPLTAQAVIEFAVATVDHYRALQCIVQDACQGWDELEDEVGYGFMLLELHRVIVDFDRALGNSAKLNALLKTYVPEYEGLVHFHTIRDLLLEHRAEVAKPENHGETAQSL